MSLNPETRTIHELFTHPYQIDYYQREYKWGETHVQSLLQDVCFKFDQHYRPEVDVSPEVVSRFAKYAK
jgi:hypothetical protein